jgi:hypothetical protein
MSFEKRKKPKRVIPESNKSILCKALFIWLLSSLALAILIQAADPVAPAQATAAPTTGGQAQGGNQGGNQGQNQGKIQGQSQGQNQGQNQGQQHGQIAQNPNVSGNNSAVSSIPQSAAAGGITITQPQQTAAQSYYKIAQGISVTFGWNFTSVLRYPSSLVVQAYCSENRNTYTIASSLAGTATAITWAPYDFDQSAIQLGQPQLIQATYRLQIFDERGLSVGLQPGLFQPNTKVEFALYQPKPYTPISSGWICAGCNSATRSKHASLFVSASLILFVTFLIQL